MLHRHAFNPAGRVWPQYALALLLGGLSVLAFAPFSQFWLLPILLAILFRLSDDKSARQAVWLGLCYGLGQFSFGIAWIVVGLAGAGGAPLPLALAMLVGLVILLSLFLALSMGLANHLAPRPSAARHLLWLPAIWTLVEWLRSWVFSGFPWLSIGYSQIDSPLVSIAPILGVFGISWTLALTAGLLAWLTLRKRYILPGLAGVATIWLAAAGLGQIQWTRADGDTLKVALVQGNIPQSEKWSENDIYHALNQYRWLSRLNWDAGLIIWPETAVANYYHDAKPHLDELSQELKARQTTLITGLMTVDFDKRQIFNSAMALGNGEGVYSKRHLVPYGEYFPVPDFVRRWMAANGMPYTDLTPGSREPEPTHANDIPLGISICYEDIFGDLLSGDAATAAVLVNISDDAWFGRSIGPEQHFEIARMRAAETGRYLLRSDNSAVTGIVTPTGAVARRLPGHEEGILTGRVRPYTGQTPYSRWNSWPIVIWSGLLIVLALGGRAISRHRGK